MTKEIIQKTVQFIKECEGVLIGAGAGLTAAVGINYTDKKKFAEVFPAWVKRGFSMQYQLMGYRNWTQAEQWGYYTTHLKYVYFQQKTNQLYQQLLSIIGDKDYFVMTSNVDELFHKNGFDTSRIYTPQGSYGKIQCTTPCSDRVWDIVPFYEKMLVALDPVTQVLTDKAAIPQCPICGENMFINVRIDNSFLEKPYLEERQRLTEWLSENRVKKLALIELGAGYNTPGVIRIPMESIHANFANTSFIRVNMDYAQIPNAIRENSISIQGDIKEFINNILKFK